jgi:hypothetical protein
VFDQLFIFSIIMVVKCQQGHPHQFPFDEHHNLKIILEVLVIGELELHATSGSQYFPTLDS